MSETELISKKDLLLATGISYGQLYRWKRKGLIPEEWFIRKSTFTGQETFFPRDQVMARVEKIKTMKDEDVSLDSIAEAVSPNLAETSMPAEDAASRGIVSAEALELYRDVHPGKEPLAFGELLTAYVLDRLLRDGRGEPRRGPDAGPRARGDICLVRGQGVRLRVRAQDGALDLLPRDERCRHRVREWRARRRSAAARDLYRRTEDPDPVTEAEMMVKTNDKNARIAGEGQLTGGSYGAVTINGAGSIKGDVTASTVRINGAGNADGNVKADAIVVNGSASFGRDVQASEMTVNGDSSVAGGAGVGQLKVKGRFFVGGGRRGARGRRARANSPSPVDLSADRFVAEGAFTIGGLLNAESVDIKLHAPSKAREIGGREGDASSRVAASRPSSRSSPRSD